ncbi:HTTM domain-containing protein [Hymenobacter sp. AT01-02]|uniref:HTTM domain-containing protein n=1 Tax=Hymenobacter sp. AT01-02 TaxID=1571877 RepID=UPI0005F20647|nr:HTTM domain-containing protein [Hymenobacter sp. AT01-02]
MQTIPTPKPIVPLRNRQDLFLSESQVRQPSLAYHSDSPVSFDRLCLFCFGWAMASLLHCLSFSERFTSEFPFSYALIVAASLVILNPRSVGLFLVMVSMSLCNTLTWMPQEPNHILFEFIVNLGILSALGWALFRHFRAGGTREMLQTPLVRVGLFNAFAPFVRLSLVVLYFFAVLHKLNWDYFNIDISCSTVLLKGYGHRLPFIPINTFTQWGAVVGTLVVETAIPVLLCFRRTRLAGILLGMGFHYFLAIHPAQGLFSFSGLLFASYLLFVPMSLPGKVQQLATSWFGKATQKVAFACRALLILGILGLVAAGATTHAVGLLVCLVWGALLIAGYLLMMRGFTAGNERMGPLLRVQTAAFWLVPTALIFNGLNPYLGLKTEKSFSMFSNLRTEGGVSNHVLIRKVAYLTDVQNDLIDIKATNLAALQAFADQQELITYFKLRSITSTAKQDFYAQYTRNGVLQTVRVVNGVST